MLPSEAIPDEIYGFFKNTLGRNGIRVRPDIGSNFAFHPSFGTAEAILEDISSMKISNGEDENITSVSNPSLLSTSAAVNASELATKQKNWSAANVGKQHFTPSPSSLPDLTGDLDSQFRCLRQVQYHLEYLFDGFLQSVQEGSSADKFHKDPFHIPTCSFLGRDAASPRLQLLSPAQNNGRDPSPVSCSQSTECVSQHSQNESPWDMANQQSISAPSGTDVPHNGFSPSSCADSDVSSVSWFHGSEDSAMMHGNGIDTYLTRKV